MRSTIFCVLAVLLFGSGPARAIEPIERFARLPAFIEPKLSPDGQYLASKIVRNGREFLAVINLFDEAEAPKYLPLGDVEARSWLWVNDEWLVVRVSTPSKAVGYKAMLTRAISMSRKTGVANLLAWTDAGQIADRILWSATDGSPRILLARQTTGETHQNGFWPEVTMVDVSTGKYSQAVGPRSSVFTYFADGKGVVRMAHAYYDDTHTGELFYRDRDGQGFRSVDRADLDKREKLRWPVALPGGPGEAIIASDVDGYRALYKYDIDKKTLGEKLIGVDGYDVGSTFLTDGGDVAGVDVVRDRPEIHWFDPELATIQADVNKALGGTSARIITWSRDHTHVVVRVGDADQPGAFYSYQPGHGRMQRLGWVNSAFGMRKLSPVTTIHYPARDGLSISAVLTLPRGQSQKLPLIVLPHDISESRDDEEWNWLAQFLADRGYAVIQPNYRGSSGFGTAFEQAGLGQWGSGVQDDLLDAVGYLADQGRIDRGRVCIVGIGFGGYAAMRAAERDGATYRCAVSYAGISDLNDLRSYDDNYLRWRMSSHALKDYVSDVVGASPIHRPEKFSVPILLVHGKKDLSVPVDQSRSMAARLKASGKVYQYVEQPLADHELTGESDRLQFLQSLEAFLKQYNPA